MVASLETGKAGEHLVCAELILAGHRAFLADQGCPFDVVAVSNGQVLTIQVKTTWQAKTYLKSGLVYRFSLRHGNGNRRREVRADVYAFVVLDSRQVGYILGSDLISKSDGKILGCIEFGADDSHGWLKRRLDQCQEFPPKPRPKVILTCHPDRKHFALGLCKQCWCKQRHIKRVQSEGRYWRTA